MTHTCLVCARAAFHEITPPPDLGGISSDIKPYPRSFPLLICQHCGHVQKRLDDEWQRLANDIYAGYQIYHLSDGAEQVVFQDGASQARSARVLATFASLVDLPQRGKLLDAGCGNGVLLRSFNQMYPDWMLFGQEINASFRETVEQIPGVQAFYAGSIDAIPERFDLISLLHVLEHVPEPLSFLRTLAGNLMEGGLLLIQVPDFRDNPYDLLVADHSSHFSPGSLTALAMGAGFEIVSPAEHWIPKEISLLLRPKRAVQGTEPVDWEVVKNGVAARLTWLAAIRDHARQLASEGSFGIFGTATGGTWLAGVLGDDLDFFVDEDTLKAGKKHLGRPVFLPDEAPPGSMVYLALSPVIARKVCTRLQEAHPALRFVLPPDMA